MGARLVGFAAATLVAALTAVAAWRVSERPRVAPEAARELSEAHAWASRLESRLATAPLDSVSAYDALSAGYLLRHRLGIGTPFRLVEQALRDPQLGDASRQRLAWALLARVARGEGSSADPAALDDVGATPRLRSPIPGEVHARVIDSAVTAAEDPRAGELAVRLAYDLAAASGSAGRRAGALGSQAAALARDRALAMRDAQRLLDVAARAGEDPLSLLVVWRAERRFAVERPLQEPLPADVEREAIQESHRLFAHLERLASAEPDSANAPRIVPLGEGAARRLAGVVEGRKMPPQAPVAVTVSGLGTALNASASDAAAREWRARFVATARNEETLAAEYALLAARERTPTEGPAQAVLGAAVAMRAFAQEVVWYPGDGGPTDDDLRGWFGVTGVSFDDDVPQRWRPYYRRLLATALGDLQRVMPALRVQGLSVHFGDSPLRSAALALHDPGKRRLYLPPATGAGAIAHEIAHDLDWQASRVRYGVRGSYSTDRAVRADGDELAASVRELAGAGAVGAMPSQRPTEVFARNVDWFVAAALAREGRMNGYLTAVQDGLLTGYAVVTSPEAAREAGDATMRALGEMTTIPDETRLWFAEEYGRGRRVPPYELVRRVLQARLGPSLLRDASRGVLAPLGPSSAPGLASVAAESPSCRADGRESRLGEARAGLAMLAAEARALGIVRRRARYAAGSDRATWEARITPDGMWSEEATRRSVENAREAVLAAARRSEGARGVWGVVHAAPLGAFGGCGGG